MMVFVWDHKWENGQFTLEAGYGASFTDQWGRARHRARIGETLILKCPWVETRDWPELEITEDQEAMQAQINQGILGTLRQAVADLEVDVA